MGQDATSREAEDPYAHYRDPNLRFLGLRLVFLILLSTHAFGLLLAVLSCLSLAIVFCTESVFVGFCPWGSAARTIERDRNPPVDSPELATDFFHPLVQ